MRGLVIGAMLLVLGAVGGAGAATPPALKGLDASAVAQAQAGALHADPKARLTRVSDLIPFRTEPNAEQRCRSRCKIRAFNCTMGGGTWCEDYLDSCYLDCWWNYGPDSLGNY